MKDSEMFMALRNGDVEAFNRLRAGGEVPDLEGANLRGADFRGADLQDVSLKNAYLPYADLRGSDLRSCNLEGASIKEAHISGVYFPADIPAQEILMSVQYGTRLRTQQ